MMFPPDSLRQKMLFKTEWKTTGVHGKSPSELSEASNKAIESLLADGYNISQLLLLDTSINFGALIVGQRVSSPMSDPTPHGVPIAGTAATQSLEIIYSYTLEGTVKTEKMMSFKEAVQRAALHLDESVRYRVGPQPIGIHVTSITAYGPGDLHVLREKFG